MKLKKFEKATIIIDGGKGGVGKSFVGRFVAHLLTEKGKSFTVIDCDPKAPIVGLTYAKEIYQGFESGAEPAKMMEAGIPQLNSQIIFTEKISRSSDVDRILDFSKCSDTLVILPANVSQAVNTWSKDLDLCGINEDSKEPLLFIKLFVVSGDVESEEFLQESLNSGGGKIPHVIILNEGIDDARLDKFADTESVKALLALDCVSSFRLPLLNINSDDAKVINDQRLTFAEAASKDLGKVGEGTWRRTQTWIKNTTEIFRGDPYLSQILFSTQEKAKPVQSKQDN
jgi:hypothetical protein